MYAFPHDDLFTTLRSLSKQLDRDWCYEDQHSLIKNEPHEDGEKVYLSDLTMSGLMSGSPASHSTRAVVLLGPQKDCHPAS